MPKPTTDERLEALYAVLTNPKRQIGSIQRLALEHGFEDLTAFNKAFQKRYGSSPVDIRKAVRKGRMRIGSNR